MLTPTAFLGLSSIWVASLMHALQAICIIMSPEAIGGTGAAALMMVFGNRIEAGLAMLLIAWSGLVVAFIARMSNLVTLIVLLPQQSLLMISAIGAVLAVVNGAYADGIVRPWVFILVDQSPILALTVAHTAGIFYRLCIVAR